jgi:hypothetical protein
MKEIIATTGNILLTAGNDEVLPRIEFCIVYSEPDYVVDDSGQLCKRRTSGTARFVTDPKGLIAIANDLTRLAEEAEAAADKLNAKAKTP